MHPIFGGANDIESREQSQCGFDEIIGGSRIYKKVPDVLFG